MLTHLAWLLLLLPGLWCVRRYAPALCTGGPLQQLGLGYLATFALITPLSIAGYLLRLEVAVVGVGLALLVMLGAALSWRDRARLAPLDAGLPDVVGGLCLLALLLLQARLGGWLDGDATFHVGRIRDVLEHGLSNHDILVRPERFSPTYHTNLLHAVYASVAWLTAQSPIDVWFHSQVWATLVVGGGHYLLGHVLTGQRVGGWALCLLALGARASVTYTLYPNALSIGWLLPLLSGLVLLTLRRDGEQPAQDASVTGQAQILLAAGAAVVAQVHALYAVYALGLWAPVLLVSALRGGTGPRRRALRSLAALSLGVPLIVVAADRTSTQVPEDQLAVAGLSGVDLSPEVLKRWGVTAPRTAWQDRSPDTAKTGAQRAGGGHLEKRLERLASGGHVLRPRHMGGWWWLCAGFAALLWMVWRDRQGRRLWGAVFAMAAALAVLLLVPAACTAAVAASPAAFIIARLATWLSTLLMCGVAGAAAVAVTRAPRPLAALMPVLVCAVAVQLPGHAPRTMGAHIARAFAPDSQRHKQRSLALQRQRLLRKYVPAGGGVLCDLALARHLTMLHDVSVVAADRGMSRATDVSRRRRDVRIMLAPRTPPHVRQALLQHYDLRHVVYWQRHAARYRWVDRRVPATHEGGGLRVARL